MARRLALSVSQLNEYVRRLLLQDPLLCEVELKGEISNLKQHQTGTVFFTLKDEQAAIACVMYASDAYELKVEPFDGMRAVVTGSVGLYAKGGQYQFYAREIRAQGIGVLFERYQMLREHLEREGLFAQEKKNRIPGFIDTVGVVSSPTGAVIHDIMSVSLRRDPQARILLCPVRVQGADAADEVVEAIKLLERMDSVSVIVLARGGGSLEDLWTFNEERVVRAVAACSKPVVSAIGHETDFTLCDFAADLRAPTPSAAAECVVPVRAELEGQLSALKLSLQRCAEEALVRADSALALSKARLFAQHPLRKLDESKSKLEGLKAQLHVLADSRLSREEKNLSMQLNALHMLSPYQVLERGYAIVRSAGRIVTSPEDVRKGDQMEILVRDGRICAEVVRNGEQTMGSDEGES